jgi:orotidine-5'-phosphate decarboxylase
MLCRTSNPGGSDLQFLATRNGRQLYQHVAELVATKWNAGGQCALVVGATFPAELAEVRRLVGAMPCWCRASAPRAATSRQQCVPAGRRPAPAS